MAEQAVILTDIGFGDAGKGTTVDYLVRRADSAVVIRYNGGAQAAHNVVTPGWQHHTFAQFGSGSFLPAVRTHLSRFMLINPLNMLSEGDRLEAIGVSDPWGRTSVEEDAVLITPWQRSANRLRELARGEGRHGSCGQGIGETRSDALCFPELAIRAGDTGSFALLVRKLRQLCKYKYQQLREELGALDVLGADAEWQAFTDPDFGSVAQAFRQWAAKVKIVGRDYLHALAAQHELLVFEGAQGVLLDEWRGFHPYTTWTRTTPHNALELLQDCSFGGDIRRLGIMRAYTTRHGAGPFVTEDEGMTRSVKDVHNGTGQWAGAFRVGHLDLVAHAYALEACEGIDALVVTGLDRMAERDTWLVCDRYRLHEPHADASDYLGFDAAGLVRSLKLGTYRDRPYQARLTEQLSSCRPVYSALTVQDTAGRQDELLWTIEDRLGLPIALASFGPTAVQKRPVVIA